MKKTLALLLTALLLVMQLVLPASASDTTGGPVVDVDLSAYDGTPESITNAVAGSSTTFAVTGNPTKGSFINQNGEVTTYLQLAEAPEGATSGLVSGTGSRTLQFEDSSAMDQEATTIVFWAETPANASYLYQTYFKLAQKANASNYLYGLNTVSSGMDRILIRDHNPTGGTVTTNITHRSGWSQYAVIKTYNETSNVQNYTVKITGASGSGTITAASNAITTRPTEYGAYYFNFGAEIPMKVSGIKVYNTALTSDIIASMYEAEKGDYVYVSDVPEGGEDPDPDPDPEPEPEPDSDAPAVKVEMTSTSVTNSGSDSLATVTKNGAPTYHSFYNSLGTETSYMQMGEVEEGTTNTFAGTTGSNAITVTSPTMNAASSGSVSFWTRRDASLSGLLNSGYGNLCKYIQSGNASAFFNLAATLGDQNFRLVLNGTNNTTNYVMWTNKNEWDHVVLTWTYNSTTGATSGTVYKNGAYSGSENGSRVYDKSSGQFIFGDHYHGAVSGIKIYEKVLTTDEIATLHTEEAPLYVEGEAPVAAINVSFTDGDGAPLAGFAGKASVVATAAFQGAAAGQTVTPVLALYEGDVLKKCAVGESITIAADGTGEATAIINLADVTLNENQSIKLFLWENLSTLKPITGSEPLPYGGAQQPSETYSVTIDYTASQALNPSTVTTDNVFLVGANNQYLTVNDVFYIPASNQLRLYVQEAALAPCRLISGNITTAGGTNAAINDTVYPYIETPAQADGVTATSIRYFDGATPTYNIANNSDLRVLIQIANTSGTDYDALPYTLTINGDANRVVKSGTVAIGRDSTVTLECDITGTVLAAGEEIAITFQI